MGQNNLDYAESYIPRGRSSDDILGVVEEGPSFEDEREGVPEGIQRDLSAVSEGLLQAKERKARRLKVFAS